MLIGGFDMDYNDKLKSLRKDRNKTIDTIKKLDESKKEERNFSIIKMEDVIGVIKNHLEK